MSGMSLLQDILVRLAVRRVTKMQKKEQYILIGMIALVVVASVVYYNKGTDVLMQTAFGSCVDTDNGDIYIGGEAYYGSNNHKVGYTPDRCSYKDNKKTIMFESYCEQGVLKVKEVDCQGSCIKGACMYYSGQMEAPRIIQTESPYITTVVGSKAKCVDSDNENVYKRGFVQWISEDGTRSELKTDECAGDSVIEYACSAENRITSKTIACPERCQRGICS